MTWSTCLTNTDARGWWPGAMTCSPTPTQTSPPYKRHGCMAKTAHKARQLQWHSRTKPSLHWRQSTSLRLHALTTSLEPPERRDGQNTAERQVPVVCKVRALTRQREALANNVSMGGARGASPSAPIANGKGKGPVPFGPSPWLSSAL